jgi:hypothetical protein
MMTIISMLAMTAFVGFGVANSVTSQIPRV